jgi:tetratricopeptide (TPR) repeat protein
VAHECNSVPPGILRARAKYRGFNGYRTAWKVLEGGLMRISHSLLLLLVGACTYAADSAPEPAGLLYDRGVKLAEEGKLQAARRTLGTLVNTYPKSVEAAGAQNAIDALLLFEDGQARLLAGKYGTARLAFQTLVAVYPESPLAPRAAQAAQTAAGLEQAESKAPIVRSLRFENLQGVTVQDILQRFQEREIDLAVEKACDARMLEEAKRVLAEFLAEKGVANPLVQVSTREIPPRSIELTFRVRKD